MNPGTSARLIGPFWRHYWAWHDSLFKFQQNAATGKYKKNEENQKMKKTKGGLKSKALVIFGTLLFVIFINDLSEKLALNPKQFNGGTSYMWI